MAELHDMHCHLDFMANAKGVAMEAEVGGTLLFANTVTPEGWVKACELFSALPNVAIGCGMHPWWIESAAQSEQSSLRAGSQRAEHRRQEALIAARGTEPDAPSEAQRLAVLNFLDAHNPTLIGEVGLDFGWQHLESKNAQMNMFSSIATWAAARGDKLVSIHSVKAARETIDILETAGTTKTCACLFHWFTGPSDLLKRAIDDGCYFSCGPRMLATRKGREYVKAIPANRLLLETDAPPEQGAHYSYGELRTALESVAKSIAAIKGEATLDVIAATSRTLLT